MSTNGVLHLQDLLKTDLTNVQAVQATVDETVISLNPQEALALADASRYWGGRVLRETEENVFVDSRRPLYRLEEDRAYISDTQGKPTGKTRLYATEAARKAEYSIIR
jgi:hypothetical protein